MEIGITGRVRSVFRGMQQGNRREGERFEQLNSRYQSEWRNFTDAVNRWGWLRDNAPGEAASVREAEFAIQVAEERYRCARNEMAEYLMACGTYAIHVPAHDRPVTELLTFEESALGF